jgi:hypothetical protein
MAYEHEPPLLAFLDFATFFQKPLFFSKEKEKEDAHRIFPSEINRIS